MEISALHQLYLKSRVVSTDSRNIAPRSIFFALKGDQFNGNRFALEAIEKGAMAAVVDEDPGVQDERIIMVDNVLLALQELAAFHRMQTGVKVLAITGSNGKTTTKELCKSVLSAKYIVHATEGNLNNHIGVPLTLLAMPADTNLAIVEMGANHPGEIAMLCRIALPDYGLITNIGKAHLEGFGGIEGVAKAKGELFQYLVQQGKTIFLNAGNPYLGSLVPAAYQRLVRYNGPGGMTAENLSCNPLLQLTVASGTDRMNISTNLVGCYNAENILAACAVGVHMGISPSDIGLAIHSYQPKNNRSQLINTGKNKVFMDAYNANPSSMAAAINEFLLSGEENKLFILGEMREVGEASEKEHLNIINLLTENGVSGVICVGKAFEKPATDAGYHHAEGIDQLSAILRQAQYTDHYILVKGSRSNQLEKIIGLL